jgi:hypothetical protein
MAKSPPAPSASLLVFERLSLLVVERLNLTEVRKYTGCTYPQSFA